MSLAALLLATPLFGLALNPPTLDPMVSLQVSAAQLGASVDDEWELGGGVEDADADREVDADAEEPSGDGADATEDGDAGDEDSYEAQLRRRNKLADIHRPLGIATWAAMTATVGLGFIQYYNLYGFFADQGSNPCVQGDAVFGQDQCSGAPWPHRLAASLTAGLYAATFTVSLMMPDPDDLSSGKGEFASTLRMHKLLRWVHFGGMVAQMVLGIVIANGFDRANDYDTLQALATVHMVTGVVTYGALTWAGALMTF